MSFPSPYARKFVVTKDNLAYLYHAPGKKREFNAFVLDKTYYGPYDETTCIDWTDDSKWVVLHVLIFECMLQSHFLSSELLY